jgi:cytochrome c oxidase subunit 2
LRGLYGTPVTLEGGVTVIADQTYIRECIMRTKPGLVLGFRDIMPNFKGQLSEDQIMALIAYIKAMGPEAQVDMPSSPGTTLPSYGREPGIAGPGSSSIAGTKPDSR